MYALSKGVTGDRPASDEDLLTGLQRFSFDYFVTQANPRNGLVRDRTRAGSPASIAAVGIALTAYAVGVARGYIRREEAVRRTLLTLKFLWDAPQGPEPDAAGYRGFFYHFLDMETGRRVWKCELSTVDTAILMAGVLAAQAFFGEDDESETEIRRLADALYRRVDWNWARNGGATVTHGWRPGRGFLRYRWEGYDEALILYVLGLGSPTHALPAESYSAWLANYRWKKIYGRELAYAGPLFIHQMSHIWLDLRGIRDAFMRERGSDYFENSSKAAYVQRDYAIRNPRGFEGYGHNAWGLTASDGPGRARRRIDGVDRRFYGYLARGGPFGPDDGTLSPWATAASLPFAPEIVLPALEHFRSLGMGRESPWGFAASFNPTFRDGETAAGFWTAPDRVGINEGAIGLMIENHRTGLVWSLMRGCPYVISGLRRGGFAGGWL